MTACPSEVLLQGCRSRLEAATAVRDPLPAGTGSGTSPVGREVVVRHGEGGDVDDVEEARMVHLGLLEGQRDEHAAVVAGGGLRAAGEGMEGRQRVVRGHTRRHAEVRRRMVGACLVDNFRARAATCRFPCPCPGGSA